MRILEAHVEGLMLANIRIQGKILIIIAVLGLAMITISMIGYTGLRSLTDDAVKIDTVGDNVKLSARINQNLLAMNRSEYRIAMDPSEVDEALDTFNENAKQLDKRVEDLEKTLSSSRKDALAEVRKAYENYTVSAKATFEKATQHKAIKAEGVRAEIEDQVHQSRVQINALNTKIKVLGSGPIELFTKQMIGDSLSLEATGGMYERTILVER